MTDTTAVELQRAVAAKFIEYKRGNFYVDEHRYQRYAREVIALCREFIARDIEALRDKFAPESETWVCLNVAALHVRNGAS